jgi:hypothetical protein
MKHTTNIAYHGYTIMVVTYQLGHERYSDSYVYAGEREYSLQDTDWIVTFYGKEDFVVQKAVDYIDKHITPELQEKTEAVYRWLNG